MRDVACVAVGTGLSVGLFERVFISKAEYITF